MLPKMRSEVAVDEIELRGSLIAERKRCGKPNCRCARGELHGPYYYRRWRDESGRQRKEYVPRERSAQMRRALDGARSNSLWVRLRELRKSIKELDGDSKIARRRAGEELGRYWHGRELRERRSFPAEQRDRVLYWMRQNQIATALGWKITEGDFVELQRMIRSERKRRNRMRLPWRTVDPTTGEPVVCVVLDLRALPSYRAHVAKQVHDDGTEVTGRE